MSDSDDSEEENIPASKSMLETELQKVCNTNVMACWTALITFNTLVVDAGNNTSVA